jgi:hypothetical protein
MLRAGGYGQSIFSGEFSNEVGQSLEDRFRGAHQVEHPLLLQRRELRQFKRRLVSGHEFVPDRQVRPADEVGKAYSVVASVSNFLEHLQKRPFVVRFAVDDHPVQIEQDRFDGFQFHFMWAAIQTGTAFV